MSGSDERTAGREEPPDGSGADDGNDGGDADAGDAPTDDRLDDLRATVESKYDFDDFDRSDMARMTAEEWEAAFDAETWITGARLLGRVEADLRSRIAGRDVFAVLERVPGVAEEDRLLAYSDEGYAVVYPDGSVEGEGTVLRDVKPSVALCSMAEYAPNEPPADAGLPAPEEVASGTGEFGNWILQFVAASQLLVGVGLLGFWIFTDLSTIVAPVAAAGFVLVGVFLFTVVANARLSDKFRVEEYRDRLRAVGVTDDERPPFVPDDDALATPPTDGHLVAGEAGEGDGRYAVEGGAVDAAETTPSEATSSDDADSD